MEIGVKQKQFHTHERQPRQARPTNPPPSQSQRYSPPPPPRLCPQPIRYALGLCALWITTVCTRHTHARKFVCTFAHLFQKSTRECRPRSHSYQSIYSRFLHLGAGQELDGALAGNEVMVHLQGEGVGRARGGKAHSGSDNRRHRHVFDTDMCSSLGLPCSVKERGREGTQMLREREGGREGGRGGRETEQERHKQERASEREKTFDDTYHARSAPPPFMEETPLFIAAREDI